MKCGTALAVLFTSYLRPQCCSRKGVAMEVGQPRIRVATAQKGAWLGCSSRYLQSSDGNSCRIELVHQILEFVPPLGDVCRDLAIAARSEAASPRRCDQNRV